MLYCNTLHVKRSGVTVIEVMFAMLVALVGLLGIASLLPLAGRNARESVVLAEGQALGHSWFDDLQTRGIGNKNNYYFYQDFTDGTLNPGSSAFSNLKTKRSPYSNSQRVLTRQPVCVDPAFFSSRDIAPNLSSYNLNGNQPAHWYRPAVFPYYVDSYNPIVDPAFPYNNTYALPDQPRMQRVTLGSTSLGTMSSKLVNEVFAAADDYVIDMDADDSKPDATVPPVRLPLGSRISANSTATFDAKFAFKNEYSWMATICPTDTTTDTSSVEFGLLSLVVFHKRDFVFSLPTARTGDPDVENKPQGERMFRVVPQVDINGNAVPFQGGFGGAVTLVGSDGVKSNLHVGDWILLCKNRLTQSVFRWYRISTINDSPEYGPVSSFITNGTGPSDVWGRQVTLDGPDWVFDTNPTMAVYMPSVVAVFERIVPY